MRENFGNSEFQARCASCHGVSGKGNGALMPLLPLLHVVAGTDAAGKKGIFPINRAHEVVEGDKVPAHGSLGMPIWGLAYRLINAESYFETEYETNAPVRERILFLLECVSTMQVC